MGDHVRAKLDPTLAEPALLSRLEEALASLGAALGANDATNIERQFRTALESGATKPQLEQAVETAKTVQENAARIHLREAERLSTHSKQSLRPRKRPSPRRLRLRSGRGEQARRPALRLRTAAGGRAPGDDATATNRSKGPQRAAATGRQAVRNERQRRADRHRCCDGRLPPHVRECVPPAGRARRDHRPADRD